MTATESLRAVVKPDACIYLVERSRSRSDITTIVDMKVVDVDHSIRSIAADVAAVCALHYSQERDGIIFRAPTRPDAIVLSMGRKLFGDASHVRAEWL